MIRIALVTFEKMCNWPRQVKEMSLVQETWTRIVKEKTRVLQDNAGIATHANDLVPYLGVGDLAQFRASLATLIRRFSDESVNKTISRIYPSLDYVKSFTQAITACTQANGAASLVWGAGLILLEVRLYPVQYLASIPTITETK